MKLFAIHNKLMEVYTAWHDENRKVSTLRSRDGVIVLFPRLITAVELQTIRTLRGTAWLLARLHTLLIRGLVKHRRLRHQQCWRLPNSDLFHSDWNQAVRSSFGCRVVRNLQDIHSRTFLVSSFPPGYSRKSTFLIFTTHQTRESCPIQENRRTSQ